MKTNILNYPSLVKFFTNKSNIDKFTSESNPVEIRNVLNDIDALIDESKVSYTSSKKSLLFFLSLMVGYLYLVPKLILVANPSFIFWSILSLVSFCFLSSIRDFFKSWKFIREIKILKKTIQYKWNGVNKVEKDDFEFNTKGKIYN